MESEGGITAHRGRKQRTGKGAGLYNLKLSHSNLLPLGRLQLQKLSTPFPKQHHQMVKYMNLQGTFHLQTTTQLDHISS